MESKSSKNPALPIKGRAGTPEVDPRATAYGDIAKFHASLVEAKWRARTAGVPAQLTVQNIAEIAIHCEASIAFLAEELLKLGKTVEDLEAHA